MELGEKCHNLQQTCCLIQHLSCEEKNFMCELKRASWAAIFEVKYTSPCTIPAHIMDFSSSFFWNSFSSTRCLMRYLPLKWKTGMSYWYSPFHSSFPGAVISTSSRTNWKYKWSYTKTIRIFHTFFNITGIFYIFSISTSYHGVTPFHKLF